MLHVANRLLTVCLCVASKCGTCAVMWAWHWWWWRLSIWWSGIQCCFVFQIYLVNEYMNQHVLILECVVCSAYCVLPGDPMRINKELGEECISCNIQFTYNVALIFTAQCRPLC